MVAAILSKPTADSKYKFSLQVKEHTTPAPQTGEAVVKIQAAALNHRDVWILKGLYPGIVEGSVLGADCVGVLAQPGSSSVQAGQRVLISPSVNWDSDPRGPEGTFGILGLLPFPGTLTDTINIDGKEVFPCPSHLSTAEAAALPLAGLTAFRALFTKSEVRSGDHVLVPGIGGGVALFALQFAVAAGAHVYVTSSSEEKIKHAISLGAKGGVNYKDPNAGKELKKLLNGNLLSAVVDGSGGALFDQYVRVMKTGGIITQYGQTASPKGVNFNMTAVLKNVDIRGSTMGSRAEFKQMLEFVEKHKIRPIVSHVFNGLTQENMDKAIAVIDAGQQTGKVVLEINENLRQKL
ncbi:hypothetical protein BDA99DRAFT_209506 [Phascolomyces articulosus]|uniref:Enoyl reductase (ER) domain-containing protein n=1 Tax=Phascolomyces articulosus TaxID=60185 RepID=A0AAD5JR49_9FUNG|nr:hypothetical protein BDA99DRAFT_209506 [Phascolomyces articulosus]